MTPPLSEARQSSGFDRIARLYRWMEYVTFGTLLMRARTAYLEETRGAKRALVLGDGDGRFTSALIERNQAVQVVAVDNSASMLQLLRRRAARMSAQMRVQTCLQDARATLPDGPFDLVCTHFFLDCLTEGEIERLAKAIAAKMPSGQWIVSEFTVPQGWMRLPATLLIALLYRAFRLLTGLEAQVLPDHGKVLHASGFTCVERRARLFGVLCSERWQRDHLHLVE